LRAATRKRWPSIEWFVQVEFQRRGALHLNLLIKGVPVNEREQLHDVLVERWCARVDAEPVGQWSGAIADAEGVVKYLSKMLAHGLKAEQAPPIGWRGHRTSQTRGYLVRPASEMRVEARAALRLKRKLWRGLSLEVAEHELRQEQDVVWSLHGGLGADPARQLQEQARAPFRVRPDARAAGVSESAPVESGVPDAPDLAALSRAPLTHHDSAGARVAIVVTEGEPAQRVDDGRVPTCSVVVVPTALPSGRPDQRTCS